MHPEGTAFAAAVEAVRSGEKSVDAATTDVLELLTDNELMWLLDGDKTIRETFRRISIPFAVPVVTAGRIDRVGIPGVRFTDGPRGVTVGEATSFPVAIARAATWDVDIERRVAAAIGAEARAIGANFWGGLCVNVAPSPGWGRTQESYGEDPHLIGEMAAGAIEGARPWVITSVKHFALNSMEEARFYVDVRTDDDVLHERYLPHFRRAVEAGVDSVMSAYNSVNGQWAGQNPALLTDILRGHWGFTGFVHTDWVWGLRDPVQSVTAGQDLEMPFRQQRARALPDALRSGTLARTDLLTAARRLVETQIRFAVRAEPTPPAQVVAGAEHRVLASEVAHRATVLLRNETADGTPLLPLAEAHLTRVAVLGRLADQPNLGDVGSSNATPPESVSILAGLRERLGDRVISGDADAAPQAAADLARDCDAAVVVVGLTPADEGESLIALESEALKLLGGPMTWKPAAKLVAGVLKVVQRRQALGGDRRDLGLHAGDIALIQAVAAANPRIIVVVIGGGTVIAEPWDRDVAALLMAWYPGMEGGRAIADVILGDAEPAGRMPVATPQEKAHVPQVDWRARSVTYSRWWGQRKLDYDGISAAYPLGFGLGYTTFTITDLSVSAPVGESLEVSVTVSNTGSRDGRHVVQVYAVKTIDQRPVRHLVGFSSVPVPAGQQRQVSVTCSTRPLQRWTADGFVLDAGEITVEAGGYCGDPNAARADLLL